MSKIFKGYIAIIAISENGEAIVSRCEIKGTNAKTTDAKTIGILVKAGGDLLLKDCKVHS